MRPTRLLPALAVLTLLGCQPSQHTLLLTVHSQSDIADVRVTVLALDRVQRHDEPLYRVDRSAAEIAEEPIHIVVSLPQGEGVLVHVDATTPEGEHLYATRCYPLSGLIQDEVLLFGPLGSLDIDGDGYVVDPSTVCRELDAGGAAQPCDDDLYVCPDGRASDCSEGNGSIHPGARTICLDDVDQDCDGMDEPCGDRDADGFPACPAMPTGECDCDDGHDSINPDATDSCNDGIDQDCDGRDDCCDADGDGYQQCADGLPDCNDEDASINRAQDEICDDVDNNCNGLVDELDECRDPDQDGDGAPACGREEPGQPCDCNDCDPTVGPGAREICGNGVSEACPPGEPDEGCPTVDADGDGVEPPEDCDDNDPLVFPPQGNREPVEECGDNRSNNCIPSDADRGCSDGDMDDDGFVEPTACEGDPTINPRAMETCNNTDDDCDGTIDEGATPASGDVCLAGVSVEFDTDFGNCGGCRVTCARPAGVDPGADRCEAGTCRCAAGPACADGEACCVDGCFNLQTSEANCGACGNPCGRGETCMGGVCTCGGEVAGAGADACPDPGDQDLNVCCNETACRQIRGSDASHCGDCNIACGPSESCVGGACTCNTDIGPIATGPACDGNTCCPSDGCVDTMTDTAHCGACDRACRSGEDCSGGRCVPVCGNAIITLGESCDDDNTAGGDGCSSTCTIETGWTCMGTVSTCTPICGDGIVIGGEACDDGNGASLDGCSSACTVEIGWACSGAPSSCTADCGDGVVAAGAEVCDDGAQTPCGACNATCTAAGLGSTCGDRVVCPDTETCDDGFQTACGACNATCSGPGTGGSCGDGDVCPDRGETCDDGHTTACGACNAACEGAGTGGACGDGDVCPDLGETCDDGHATACGACNATCDGAGTGGACGDGDVCPDLGETCDDGHATACGACNATCNGAGTGTSTCGDGTFCPDVGEVCDDGHTTDCGACNATCTGMGTGTSTCGDGTFCPDVGEVCDDGHTNACGTCDATCTGMGSGSTCGDGVRCRGEEACDDGNDVPGDGCTTCTVDPGWRCTTSMGSPSECGLCGDGVVEGPETCDDGNALDCGTCDATCTGMGSGGCPAGTPCRDDDDCTNNCTGANLCN